MGNRNIIRALTWGLSFVICAAFGIYGLILSGDTTSIDNKDILKNITEYINSGVVVKTLQDDGINVVAIEGNNKIIVSYSNSTDNKDYTYTLSNNILSTTFENDDDYAKEILKIVLAANAENLGQSYSDIVIKFSTTDFSNYLISEGISYDETSITTVNINTSVALEIKEPEYFTTEGLSTYSTDIIGGDYNTTKKNLKLNVSGVETPIITISENTSLTENAYDSIISVINVIFNEVTTSDYFRVNYSSVTVGNKTFNGFKVELNPSLNENEAAVFEETDQIIRITINKSQLDI